MNKHAQLIRTATSELRIDAAGQPGRAVSLIEHNPDDRIGRTEFIVHAKDDRELWPSIDAWPKSVADALLAVAHRWLRSHPDRRMIATSSMVDTSKKPGLYIFVIHHADAMEADALIHDDVDYIAERRHGRPEKRRPSDAMLRTAKSDSDNR